MNNFNKEQIMKKTLLTALLLSGMTATAWAQGAGDGTGQQTKSLGLTDTPTKLMEKLDRGLVAVRKSSGGNFVSWRILGTDPEGTTFDLLRNGSIIARGLSVSNFTDATGPEGSIYQVVVHRDGHDDETTESSKTWETTFKKMKLDRPEGGKIGFINNKLTDDLSKADSIHYFQYVAKKAIAGDADGDGKLELVVYWQPNDAKDNAFSGFTGSSYYDCYRMNYQKGDETETLQKLWRIRLGTNIRAGSHYSQPMFYDFDGDGCAELIVKTGPGSTDSEGRYVTEAATDETIRNRTDNEADYRNGSGHVMGGPEYLTVFDGKTGRAIHTIWYNPNRGFGTGRVSGYGAWGDDYGNRGERFLACVAYLDGADKNPSAVMCRGYYTRSYLWAVDFDGKQLKQKWLHASTSKSHINVHGADNSIVSSRDYSSNISGKGDKYTVYGQGCHSIAVGDVDGDGYDEIVYGSAAVDHDGQMLYSTGLGHGDAHHLADHIPDRPGLEFMMPHEDDNNGWHVRDAATGELLIWYPIDKTEPVDNGRGMAGALLSDLRGSQFWSAADYNVYDTEGNTIVTGDKESNVRPAYSFRIYWDGDPQDELLDMFHVTKWSRSGSSRIFSAPSHSYKTGTKGHPTLMGDLFGDWREEIIYCSSLDSCTLYLCTTTTETKHAVPTLLHDHTYRMSMCWQHVAYNQPPHLGYYLPDSVACKFVPTAGSKQQTVTLGDDMKTVTCRWKNCTNASIYQVYLNGTRIKSYGVPEGFSFTKDNNAKTFTLSGKPSEMGTYEFLVRASGSNDGINITDTLTLVVTDQTGITNVLQDNGQEAGCTFYSMDGRILTERPTKGIYIEKKGLTSRKVIVKQ